MRPKQILDQETLQKNEELKKEHNKLVAAIASAETETGALEKRKASLNKDIQDISAQASATADAIYKKSYELMQEKMSQSAEIAMFRYQEAEKEYKKEYLSTLAETSQKFSDEITQYQLKINEYENIASDLKNKIDAAIEADKRKALEEDKKKYYELAISDEDKEDIALLKDVAKKLKKDPEPINKVIWEVYYKKPTMDLLGRLTPTGTTHIGIYKITNLKTNQCYIGQSVDLRNRLRDHIKAGLGISSSNNRFYTEMRNEGPEAFMYEILEKCDRSQLNEKERFWINFYSSTNWGYNTTKGVN